jgi:hypothetical protein
MPSVLINFAIYQTAGVKIIILRATQELNELVRPALRLFAFLKHPRKVAKPS